LPRNDRKFLKCLYDDQCGCYEGPGTGKDPACEAKYSYREEGANRWIDNAEYEQVWYARQEMQFGR
jgi:hypothetical protein